MSGILSSNNINLPVAVTIRHMLQGEAIQGDILGAEPDGRGGQVVTLQFLEGPVRYLLPEGLELPVGCRMDIHHLDGVYHVREMS